MKSCMEENGATCSIIFSLIKRDKLRGRPILLSLV